MELAFGFDGLEAVVVVVVVPLAGLLRLGAVGATEGLCARASEALAAIKVSDLSKVVGLMMAGFCLGTRQAVKLTV